MEIMFDDLTEEAQKRLRKETPVSEPEEMDWDTIPVAEVKFDLDDAEESEEFEADPLDDDEDFEFDDDADY